MRAWNKSTLNGNEGRYDDCSVPAVLQLGGDVMNMIVQFLRCDRQQLRGDVMGDFADIGMVVADHLGCSSPGN